jgi:hypothetical protein
MEIGSGAFGLAAVGETLWVGGSRNGSVPIDKDLP